MESTTKDKLQTRNNQSQGLPEGWSLATLGELVGKQGVFVDGDWVESKDQDPNGDVRLIQLADIGDGEYRNRSERFLTYEKALELGCTFLKKGDVVVARMPDPLGRACIFPGDTKKSVTVVDVAIIRPGEKEFETRWLMYFINAPAFRSVVASMESGSTRKRISRKNLAKILLPVPPPSIQKLIVAEIEKQFSRLDEAVATLRHVQANLKRYKASVLKAAVEGRLTEEWRRQNICRGGSRTAPTGYESGADLLKRILAERRRKWEEDYVKKYVGAHGYAPKDDSWKKKYKEPAAPDISNLPGLPEGWVWAAMPQFGELNRGKSKHRPRNAPHLYGGAYPFIQTGDIRAANGILRGYNQTYSEEGLKQSRLWPAGTLCITIAANIADTAILGFDACFPDSIVGFVAEPKHCDVRFIECFLRTAKKNIERYAPATAQKNINLEILSDVAVPLPPLSEQQAIVLEVDRRLSVAEEIEAVIETNLKRAERMRQAILKKAFEGRLVPQEPSRLKL